jgi:pentatricopeptide repeat protein
MLRSDPKSFDDWEAVCWETEKLELSDKKEPGFVEYMDKLMNSTINWYALAHVYCRNKHVEDAKRIFKHMYELCWYDIYCEMSKPAMQYFFEVRYTGPTYEPYDRCFPSYDEIPPLDEMIIKKEYQCYANEDEEGGNKSDSNKSPEVKQNQKK